MDINVHTEGLKKWKLRGHYVQFWGTYSGSRTTFFCSFHVSCISVRSEAQPSNPMCMHASGGWP